MKIIDAADMLMLALLGPTEGEWEKPWDVDALPGAAGVHDTSERLVRAQAVRIMPGGNRAYYTPASDTIRAPVREAFVSTEMFYVTLFHELSHWTGARCRLGRDFRRRAFEETVADSTAAILSVATGLTSTIPQRNAIYVSKWAERMDDWEPAETLEAAQRSAEYLIKQMEG